MTRKSLLSLFAVCAIPIYIWSIYNLLHEVPAWVLRMSVWDLVGIIAYVQAFTLFESFVVFLFLFLLSMITPLRRNENRFLAQITLAFSLISALIIVAHFNYNIISMWGMKEFLPVLLLSFTLIGGSILIVKRFRKLEEVILKILERLVVLSILYIFSGLIGVMIIIIRNI